MFSAECMFTVTVMPSRSTDYGKTFSNDTYKLNDSNVVINWYFVSPMDNNVSSSEIGSCMTEH